MAITTYGNGSTGSYLTISEMDANFGHLPTTLSYSGTTLTVGTHVEGNNLTLDTSGVDFTVNALTVKGDLVVDGTTTTVNSTIVTVDDKNIELGSIANPSDVTADGGGITLKGATDKTLNWINATDAWTSSEHFNIANGKEYRINGTSVLTSTTLGSGVTTSSLTTVGTIGTGTWQADVIAYEYGGTGQSTYAKGDILYASAANNLSKLPAGINGQVLTLANGVPAWGHTIKSPDSSTSNTSIAGIETGDATAGNYNSGNAYLATGSGYGSGYSGGIYVQTGSGGASANGGSGAIFVNTGPGTTSSGSIQITTGNSENAGSINIFPGVSSTASSGGLYLRAGHSSVNSSTTLAGTVIISGGNSTAAAGRGGDVQINAGSGNTSDGRLYLGTSTASEIGIGSSSITTKINGSLQLPNIGSTDAIMKVGVNNQVGYLTNGTDGQVLKIVSGSPTWAADNNDNTTYSAGDGIALTGTTFSVAAGTDLTQEASGLKHSDITRSDTSDTASPAYGGTFNIVDSVTTNARGHVTAVNVKTITLPSSDNTDTLQSIAASTSATEHYISFVANTSGAQTGLVNSNIKVTPSTGTVTATNFDSTSDIRFKKDLQVIENALSKVKCLNGYTFTFKETGQRAAGLVTQEVQPHLPEVIGGTDEKQTLNYDGTIALLVEAIKEQDKKIEQLEKLVAKLLG